MMRYKGYVGIAQVDTEARVIRGRVINTRDMITFQGTTVPEFQEAFRESVDDYLDFCASRGESPEKPFSGRLLVRMEPETHQALAIEAQRRGVSINALINESLAPLVRDSKAGSLTRPSSDPRSSKANPTAPTR